MNLKLILNTALFVFFLTTANAQVGFSSFGGDASGTGGSISFTAGQVVYTAHTGVSGSITQGVQQPYEISLIAGIETPYDINLTLSVYPNPVTDFLYLNVMNFSSQKLNYHLYDINGSTIEMKRIVSDITNINMRNFTPASYFLKVMDGNEIIKTYKIIKN